MRTLYRGGAVYSPADPFATALVTDGGTVAWIGSHEASAAQAGDVDAVVELDGALVTPAFTDAHVHVTETGLALGGVDVRSARSVGDILTAVEQASRSGRGRPVLAHGWDERHLAERRPPTRAELDRASAGGVVYLARVDSHSAIVSSALAQAAGARDHEGWSDDGRVERDAHHAVRAATREDLSPSAREEAQRTALRAAAAAGIGCVHEASAPHIAPEADLVALAALAGPDGEEPLPEVVAYRGQLVASEAEALAVRDRLGVALAGLAGDLNADGAVGSRTASFRAPYADAPHTSGHTYLSAEQIRDHVIACTGARLQAGFHVIGDAALDAVLEGFRRAAERAGIAAVRAARHRLEHVETPDADAVARLADLGITASVQPAFDAAWGGPDGMYAARLGTERAVRMNPFAHLAAAGVLLAFGSDSPVTPFAPWEAVRAAVFHTDPLQRISARSAFGAHTRGAARAAGRTSDGVLALGAPATLAVWAAGELVVQAPDDRIRAWSTDPRSGTPGLPDLTLGVPAPQCLRMVVRGRVVHDRTEG
jgi:predicted amidohydrolase YtcJ